MKKLLASLLFAMICIGVWRGWAQTVQPNEAANGTQLTPDDMAMSLGYQVARADKMERMVRAVQTENFKLRAENEKLKKDAAACASPSADRTRP
jgi:hypothetical protein